MVAALCYGCGDSTTHRAPGYRDQLPALVPKAVPGLDSLGPESVNASFAVSANSMLAFSHAFHSDERYVFSLMDTFGNRTPSGRRGLGPGEFRGPAPFLFFDDSGRILAIDDGGGLATFFDPSGTVVGMAEAFLQPGQMPLGVAHDSLDVAVMELSRGVTLQSIRRLRLTSLMSRAVLQRGDSVLQMIGHSRPLIATDGVRLILANPRVGRFASMGWRGAAVNSWSIPMLERFLTAGEIERLLRFQGKIGRNGELVPQWAEERERFGTIPQDHFQALALDGAGRIWAVGTDTNGIAYGDVYADSVYLGRVTIPCHLARRELRISAHWMAVICVAPDTDSGVALQLYRLEG